MSNTKKKQLREAVNKFSSTNILVLGDLNDTFESDPLQTLRAGQYRRYHDEGLYALRVKFVQCLEPLPYRRRAGLDLQGIGEAAGRCGFRHPSNNHKNLSAVQPPRFQDS